MVLCSILHDKNGVTNTHATPFHFRLKAEDITRGRLQIASVAIRTAATYTNMAAKALNEHEYIIDCNRRPWATYTFMQNLENTIEAAWECFGEGRANN